MRYRLLPLFAGGFLAMLAAGSETSAQIAPATRTPDISRPVTVTTSDQPGILTPPGKIAVEPSFQYANSSSHRVAILGYTVFPSITVGAIDVREVNRDTFIASVAARYGITNRMEVEAKLPYVFRNDSTISRPLLSPTEEESVFGASGRGIGDLEASLRYQLNSGQGGQPYWIANLRLRSHTGENPFELPTDPATGLPKELATGSGFWGVQPSLSLIYPSDPAVLFGNVSYLWNIPRDMGEAFGEVNPGDAIGFNFGMGFGLNQTMSFSLGYDHSIFGKDRRSGAQAQNSIVTHVGSLLLGYSLRLGNKTSFNVSLSAGLTEAAPDVQITIRVPVCCY
jgi:hypothetical protein